MKNSPANHLAIGIEIGGTKIQVGIGSTNGKLLPRGIIRKQVIQENGAAGIQYDLISMIEELLASQHLSLLNIEKIGIGFGGILDSNQGIVLKSFQIDGWDHFPLREWAEKQWRKPVLIQNDASTAGLAEALHGSGRGYSRIFYMTIGSGVGGGWIVNGKIDDGQGFGAAEIGHTWVPDPASGLPSELEQICSGWSIGRRARLAASNKKTLMTKIAGTVERIDARTVYSAAEMGDKIASLILDETCQSLGLAISNVNALLHPERVILGGGVSLMGSLLWNRLRKEVKSRTIPLFAPRVEIVRANLEEDVVVIGALCLE
jgi:glucokinase